MTLSYLQSKRYRGPSTVFPIPELEGIINRIGFLVTRLAAETNAICEVSMSAKQKQEANTLQPIPQEAFDWYDEYAHGFIDRRTFLKRLSSLGAAGFTMAMLTPALMPNYALAEEVSFNDADINAVYATFDAPKGHGKGRGYLVKPKNLEGKAQWIE